MKSINDLNRQLVQIKQIFLHGKKHAISNNALDRLHSIISLDTAIEYFLVTIIHQADIKLPRKDENNFDSIFENANIGLKKIRNNSIELPHKTVITSRVHKVRNGACHSGNIPSTESINTALIHTETFLNETFKLCFNKAFGEVFLADMIEHQEICKYFKKAEVAMEENDLESLTVELATGIQIFKNKVTSELPGWLKQMERTDVSTTLDDNQRIQTALGDIVESVCLLRNFTVFISLGFTFHDLTLFIAKFPIINLSVSGNILGVHHGRIKPTMSECVHLMNAFYNMILSYQSSNKSICP